MNAVKSAIAVCIVPNSTSWSSNNINIVFLLAIAEKDKQNFKDIFMNVINLFVSDGWNNYVDKIKNYQDFIKFIKE